MIMSWEQLDKETAAIRKAHRAGIADKYSWECPCCNFKAVRAALVAIEKHIRGNVCGVLTDSMED